MSSKDLERFIEVYHLIHLKEIELDKNHPQDCLYEELRVKLLDAGRNVDDFYYRYEDNGTLVFCYYKGFVLVESKSLDEQMLARIASDEAELNKTVAKRNFRRFFDLVDPRLKIELLVEVFDFIPDPDKYPVVEEVINSVPGGFDLLPDDFMQNVQRFKGARLDRPISDENDHVFVYRGQATGAKKLDEAHSWTTDVNVAVRYALAEIRPGCVYQASVNTSDIIEYVTENREKEVLVAPDKLMNVKLVPMYQLDSLVPELEKAGIMSRYSSCSGAIQRIWFANPDGIHAISHTRRVLFLALIIAYFEGLKENDMIILAEAAMYHDIGRTTDGYDSVHGTASHKKAVDQGLLSAKAFEDMEVLRFVVENHSAPDMAVFKVLKQYHFKDRERAIYLYHLFKDADGLDRVRINDLNPDYLRSAFSFRLILIAHQLFQAGEYEKLAGFFFEPGGRGCV